MNKKRFVSKKFKAFNKQEFTVTYFEITGSQPGPVLTMIAGQHGMEHIGPELLRNMISEFENMDFRGTLRICPCANPAALLLDYEFYPEKEELRQLNDFYYSIFRHDHEVYGLGRDHSYNMNRVWNRKDLEGITPAVADWIWNKICIGSDTLMDFHCLQDKKPLIYSLDTPENLKLAASFGIEAVFMNSQYVEGWNSHTLARQVTNILKIPSLTVEFSLQHGYRKADYDIGHRGIINIMKYMKMLEGKPVLDKEVKFLKDTSATAIQLKTKHVGHIHYNFDLYDPVKKGDVVFEISSIETLETLDSVKSPVDGVMGNSSFFPVSSPERHICRIFTTHQVDI